MKKFLLVLALVLCMALPAAAEPKTVTTSTDLKNAVADTNVDTIIIGASISLDADGAGNGLLISSNRTLTLQISKDCTLTVSGSSMTIGINSWGTLTIKGEGHLDVKNNGSGNTFGVYIYGGTTYIDGGVSISANGNSSTYGVQAYGSGSKANILSADISAASSGSTPYSIFESSGGTINVYAGKFSGAMDENCALGPDSTKTGTDPYIVTNNASIKFNPTSLDVAQGESGVVSVDFRASGDVTLSSFDKLEVTPASVDGITVTPSSSDGTITFNVENTCALDTYTFNVICSATNSGSGNSPHMQTETFTVTVSEAKPTPSTGSASNGGCNAGFAGLALAAFALLAAKRKK